MAYPPMDASLLRVYWPLRDWDKPYWGTGKPSSMRPRFVQRTDLIKALREHCTFFRVLWLNIRAPLCGHPLNSNASLLRTAFFVPGQSRYILTRLIRTPVNADKGYFFSTPPIKKFLDRKKLTSIIWHNQLCAVLILASDEVILGCQHFDVYSATVDGIRWSGDVNFWLFKVLNEFNTQITVFDKVMSANQR